MRVALTSGPDRQTSGGMYAFGDGTLFIAVFGVCALVPTGGALFFLRPHYAFWAMLAGSSFLLAVSGVASAVIFAVERHAPPSYWATWAAFSVVRILISPIFALMFLLCAVVSPKRSFRIAFIAATVMEAAVSAYGGAVWFLPLLFRRP